MLRSGCRWVDAPPVYGPRKTLYNRIVRWAAKGVWERVFLALAEAGGPPASILLDSSVMQAHRCAAGGKGGAKSGNWHQPRWTHNQTSRPDRRARSPTRYCAHRQPSRRLSSRRTAARPSAALRPPVGRSRLRHRRCKGRGEQRRCHAKYPAQNKPPLQAAVQPDCLPRPQRNRTHVRQAKELPPYRNALLVMSLDLRKGFRRLSRRPSAPMMAALRAWRAYEAGRGL